MKVIVRKEAGFDLAVYGLSLSFMTEGISYEEWWTEERFNKLVNTNIKLNIFLIIKIKVIYWSSLLIFWISWNNNSL